MSETSQGMDIAVPPAVVIRVGQRVQPVLAAGDDDHRGAFAGQPFGSGLADARRCPGKQNPFAAQVNWFDGGLVAQQLRRNGRAHACQHELIGEPAKRTLTHARQS